MPKRIQRKRTKGWRMPENTVCVTRPGKFGNPFVITKKMRPGVQIGITGYFAVRSIEDSIACFCEYVHIKSGMLEAIRSELRGKDLACFCPLDQPCHADVLLEIANS